MCNECSILKIYLLNLKFISVTENCIKNRRDINIQLGIRQNYILFSLPFNLYSVNNFKESLIHTNVKLKVNGVITNNNIYSK